MKRISLVMALVLVLGACGDSEPVQTTGDNPLGDDPYLDELWNRCGFFSDFAACDELFAAAPPGTEYKEFGDTCGERVDAAYDIFTCEERFGSSALPSTTAVEPAATVPASRTHPFAIVSDDGEDVEMQAVCLTVSAEGPFDEARIQDNFELDMAGLEVTARPGEDCNADLHLSVSGHRKCASYTGLGFCCPAYTIDASVTLRLDGILKKLLHFDRETNRPLHLDRSMCHDESDALAFPKTLRDEIATAMTDLFGLP